MGLHRPQGYIMQLAAQERRNIPAGLSCLKVLTGELFVAFHRRWFSSFVRRKQTATLLRNEKQQKPHVCLLFLSTSEEAEEKWAHFRHCSSVVCIPLSKNVCCQVNRLNGVKRAFKKLSFSLPRAVLEMKLNIFLYSEVMGAIDIYISNKESSFVLLQSRRCVMHKLFFYCGSKHF